MMNKSKQKSVGRFLMSCGQILYRRDIDVEGQIVTWRVIRDRVTKKLYDVTMCDGEVMSTMEINLVARGGWKDWAEGDLVVWSFDKFDGSGEELCQITEVYPDHLIASLIDDNHTKLWIDEDSQNDFIGLF